MTKKTEVQWVTDMIDSIVSTQYICLDIESIKSIEERANQSKITIGDLSAETLAKFMNHMSDAISMATALEKVYNALIPSERKRDD